MSDVIHVNSVSDDEFWLSNIVIEVNKIQKYMIHVWWEWYTVTFKLITKYNYIHFSGFLDKANKELASFSDFITVLQKHTLYKKYINYQPKQSSV